MDQDMVYWRLAHFVVVAHVLLAIFFLVGAPFTLLNPWIAAVHIPLAVWVSAALIVGWACPLTSLENRLRVAADNEGYSGGFVDHYLMPLVAPNFAPGEYRKTEVAIGIVAAVFNSVLYVLILPGLLGKG
jgi:hypothetical protein